MRAVVCTRYGPPEVLELRNVEPPIPRRDQVRIRVEAATVTSSDCIIRSFNIPLSMQIPARLVLGITKPKKPVLGMVVSGVVESAGWAVGLFEVGERVFGLDRFGFGAYADYKCMPEGGLLARSPATLSPIECAAIPYGGLLALHLLRRGGIGPDQRVLVYGASGAVGSSAVQLAKHLGARVTAVCSTTNVDLVRSLGAEAVIDYTREDFTASRRSYDVVLIAVGNRVHPPSRRQCTEVLVPGGTYVSIDQGKPDLAASDLTLLAQLSDTGGLDPVIDRTYPLEQIVEAHRYVDRGHARGAVVITLG